MVSSCCAFGCRNRFVKNGGVGFFRFPPDPVRKRLWTLALRRKNFEPTEASRICSDHFRTGKPSRDSNHPDYVPNIFVFKPSKRRGLHNARRKIYERRVDDNEDNPVEEIDGTFSNTMSQVAELFKMRDAVLNVEAELQHEYRESTDGKQEEELYDVEDELINLKLELHEAYSDISALRREKEALVKELCDGDLTQSHLHNSISEKEENLLKVKKELQQAYTEISALRTEKEELQKKLIAADVTQGILQDPSKLYFYTGLHSEKDFHSILTLLSSVKSSVKSIPLETQVIIVLMKLKLNLLYTDLAYRFQTSSKTVHRICDIIIPPLEAKLGLLVTCPINNALKKNIPVCFKNTVYENLYQRLLRNSKSKTKQSENEDSELDIL